MGFFIVNWILRNKLKWNLNWNVKFFIHKNASENIVCVMTAILSRERWVNGGTLAIRHTYMKVTCFCYPPTLWRAHVSVNHLTVGHPLMKYAGVRSLWVAVTWFNTLRPRQNGRHFADDMFIFLNKNLWIPIEILLKFVPKGSINNIRALVQIMAWRRTGDKPLSEPKMTQLNDAYMRHSASTSLNGSPSIAKMACAI